MDDIVLNMGQILMINFYYYGKYIFLIIASIYNIFIFDANKLNESSGRLLRSARWMAEIFGAEAVVLMIRGSGFILLALLIFLIYHDVKHSIRLRRRIRGELPPERSNLG